MSWEPEPGPRPDLPIESDALTDTAGNYTSDWIETSQAKAIRVACYMATPGATVSVQEGMHASDQSTPRMVRQQNVPASGTYAFGELALSARYFRVVLTDGLTETGIFLSVRVVG